MMGQSSKFIDYADNISRVCFDQKRLIYGLLVLLGFLCSTIVYIALHKVEYLIPYNMNEKVAISVNQVTSGYLASLAMADAAAYFDIDKYNVGAQKQLFLSRVDPSFMGEVGLELSERERKVISDNLAQVFYPINCYVRKNTRLVVLKGRLVKWLSSKQVQSRIINISIDYSNINGHVFIKKWAYKHA